MSGLNILTWALALGLANSGLASDVHACSAAGREISGVLRFVDRRLFSDPRYPAPHGVRQQVVQLEVPGLDVPAAGGGCLRVRTLHLTPSDGAAQSALRGKIGAAVTISVEWIGESHADLKRDWQAGEAVARGVRLVEPAR
jgi:hypothetical protein